MVTGPTGYTMTVHEEEYIYDPVLCLWFKKLKLGKKLKVNPRNGDINRIFETFSQLCSLAICQEMIVTQKISEKRVVKVDDVMRVVSEFFGFQPAQFCK
ncbi:unnamed protein product [Nippostrongylus brasiliensis]|uniref:CBFD_NFYB_HMF domain-containing protein n=1 Tax=Nippostrongylus brasiliensis TaxID=27835 RepID=A0A0N4XXD3_NIPBR|nr:unnamed protein product [Nippostrongylus brasiliensis]